MLWSGRSSSVPAEARPELTILIHFSFWQAVKAKAPKPDEPALLTVRNLSKRYGQGPDSLLAVDDVSFSIAPGECFGLLGPNGAGKSTTIQCVTGFFPPTAGSVRIDGFDVHEHPREARRMLGVCSQEENLDSDFNAVDQLTRHATYFRIPAKEGRLRAMKLLGRFGLEEKAHDMIESLSGGMRRRLQVARALISEPRVLVLDEPTTGLDPDVRRMVWEVIQEARASGRAILLCTHYMDEAERLCDRIAVISRGKILDIAPPRELISRYIKQKTVREEVRPGVFWKRPANLEDVYLKLTGSKLGVEGL